MKDNYRELLSKFTFRHSESDLQNDSQWQGDGGGSDAATAVIVKRFKDIKRDNNDDSVLSNRLTIKGDVTTESNIRIDGTIEGNLTANGNITILGKVKGNVKGACITMDGSHVDGNIESNSAVILHTNSFIVGDINANTLDIAGVINGNITATENVIFRKSAVITGNIEAGVISIAEGAVVNGKMKVTHCSPAQSQLSTPEVADPKQIAGSHAAI